MQLLVAEFLFAGRAGQQPLIFHPTVFPFVGVVFLTAKQHDGILRWLLPERGAFATHFGQSPQDLSVG